MQYEKISIYTMNKKPYELGVEDLPSIHKLQNYAKKIELFVESNKGAASKNVEDLLHKITDIKNDPKYIKLKEAAQSEAKSIVYNTITFFAETFQRDSKYSKQMPDVVILDGLDYQEKKYDPKFYMTSDNQSLSYFVGAQKSFFGADRNALISLFLPNINQGLIVEESFHFLQQVYEECKSLNKKISKYPAEIKSGFISAYELLPKDELTSMHIAHEAEAYFTVSLFNLKDNKSLMKYPEKELFKDLFETLSAEGRIKCYKQLLQSKNIESFYDLWTLGFESLVKTEFLNNMEHYLGYSLGEELHNVTRNKTNFNEMSKIIFSPVKNYNIKLDNMVGYVQQRIKV